MAVPGGDTARWRRVTRRESPYALPTPSHPPQQRFSTEVIVVLLTGLAAAGLAGFLSVSALVEDSAATTAPRAGAPDAGTATAAGTPYEGSGSEVLTTNKLYANGELAEVTCEVPGLDSDDRESMEHFLHTVTDCLDEAWGEYFESSGVPFEKPQRVYWYTSGQSPCGSYPAPGVAAFYCKANKGLYLGLEDVTKNSGESERPESYTFLLSHEYGHHVQGESGILDYLHSTESEQDHREQDQDILARRNELQANCLSGNFLGAARDDLPINAQTRANILDDAERRGDFGPETRTHGSPENGSMWTAHGMDRMNPAACNTWSARDDLVE